MQSPEAAGTEEGMEGAMDVVEDMGTAEDMGMASAACMPAAITAALPVRAAISAVIVFRPDGRALVRCVMPVSALAIRATP